MKQLGFYFGNRPSVSEHIVQLKKKFRCRLWVLRHLIKAGLNANDLLSMYKCFLLSLLDYGSVVFHPMLSKEQGNDLESL